MTKPILTVLMTVRNGEPFIHEAVSSILNQTYRNFRFLILDNASTDNSREIINAFNDPRIELVELPQDIGQVAALNRGLQKIDTPLVARMDADDISLPRRLESQVEKFNDNPEICILGSFLDIIDENNITLHNLSLPIQALECGFWMYVNGEQKVFHPCVMFKLTAIKNLGMYNVKYRIAHDSDLWFRAAAKGFKFGNIPDVLFSYRMHSKQESENPQANLEHNNALSTFLSEILQQHVDPLKAKLIRPVNFNDRNFDTERIINDMYQLKKQLMVAFFNKYNLSIGEKLKSTIILWESLYPLCKLKIVRWSKMVIKNTAFCFSLLQPHYKRKSVIYLPYFILFIFGLQKFLLIKILEKSLYTIKNIIYYNSSETKI